MDLRTLFAADTSSKSTIVTSDSEEDETLHPSSPKRQCTGSGATASSTTQHKHNKKWESFHGQNITKTTKVPFAKYTENQEIRVKLHKEVVVYESQNHSKTGKKSDTKDEGTCKQ